MSVGLGLGLLAVSVMAAVCAILVAAAIPQRRRVGPSIFDDTQAGTIFIFDDETLVDASAGARALLSAIGRRGTAWERLMTFSAARFPGAEARLARLADLGTVTIAADGVDPLVLHAEWRGGLRQITLLDAVAGARAGPQDGLAQRAQDDELGLLRAATDLAPLPMWRLGDDGAVIWANDRYMAIAAAAGLCDSETAWPPPPLFEAAEANGRYRIARRGQPPAWFEEAPTTGAADRIRIAMPVDQTVRAEVALREFIQTLALTFANLPVGLAVFDRDRRLQLFNPALADLTALRPEFLSARPTLNAVMDAMRDTRMLPEPRNYKGWRHRINALEAGPAAAAVEEVWSLANGKAYRVTVRPLPEGALAVVIEDITDSLSRLRTVRSDAAMTLAALDTVDEAVVVFHRDGTPILANEASRRLWGDAQPRDARDTVAAWAQRCMPDPVWAALADRLMREPSGDPLAATVQMRQGPALRCMAGTLPGGLHIVRFAPCDPPPPKAAQGASPTALRPAHA